MELQNIGIYLNLFVKIKNNMKTKIRFYINRLLNELFSLDDSGVQEKSDKLEKAWNRKEKDIMTGLKKITGLSFNKNYIDVFLVNREAVKSSISDPLILRVSDNVDRNLCILVHELIHNLMWDNQQNSNWSLKIQKLFPKENRKTAIHISVHAILEALYTDILENPEMIVEDVKRSQNSPDYRRAWEIVKEEGYKNIIKKLKGL